MASSLKLNNSSQLSLQPLQLFSRLLSPHPQTTASPFSNEKSETIRHLHPQHLSSIPGSSLYLHPSLVLSLLWSLNIPSQWQYLNPYTWSLSFQTLPRPVNQLSTPYSPVISLPPSTKALLPLPISMFIFPLKRKKETRGEKAFLSPPYTYSKHLLNPWRVVDNS